MTTGEQSHLVKHWYQFHCIYVRMNQTTYSYHVAFHDADAIIHITSSHHFSIQLVSLVCRNIIELLGYLTP